MGRYISAHRPRKEIQGLFHELVLILDVMTVGLRAPAIVHGRLWLTEGFEHHLEEKAPAVPLPLWVLAVRYQKNQLAGHPPAVLLDHVY
jgi:hypothetical protein